MGRKNQSIFKERISMEVLHDILLDWKTGDRQNIWERQNVIYMRRYKREKHVKHMPKYWRNNVN